MPHPSAESEPELDAELKRLLVAAAFADASEAEIARLNDLLLRHEQLRHTAARFFEEEAVLRREFALLDRVVQFHTPFESSGEVAPARAAASPSTTHARKTPWQRTYLAVALLISAIAGLAWIADRSANLLGFARPQALPLGSGAGARAPAEGIRPLATAATILAPVTHVSWSGPRFANELSGDPTKSQMREGVIPFTSAFGRPAEGFMVCLRPNTLMDLVVAADSDGENALAIIEFDGTGRPTGRRISFSNSASESLTPPVDAAKVMIQTKKGRLGIWSERNDSESPRYYLFTGVHKLLNRSADDSWHVSRLSPFVEAPDLFHVGWDDSGMPPNGDKGLPQFPDEDFDDVSATIRIRSLDAERDSSPAGLHTYSKIPAEVNDARTRSVDESDAYAFTVAAGQVAVVKVCSRSSAPVEVAVVEKGSHEFCWSCRKSNSTSPTLGICAIENNAGKPREFYVVGQLGPSDDDGHSTARTLVHSVLFEMESLVTIGFDETKKDSDFNTTRVDILTMEEL